MEKFRTWSDHKTGIQPFISKPKPLSSFLKYSRYFFGFFKFILIFIILIFSFTTLFVFSIFSFIPYFYRILIRVHSFIVYHLILFLFGYFSSKFDLYSLTSRLESKWKKPTHGDVLICNCTSYLNLFWLQAKLSPIFCIPADNKEVHHVSIFRLFLSLIRSQSLKYGKSVPIESLISQSQSKKHGPIVILPECAPTNGDGILKFGSFYLENVQTHIQILGFSQTFSSGSSPNFIAGNSFLHLVEMAGRLVSTLSIKVLLPEKVPQPKKCN